MEIWVKSYHLFSLVLAVVILFSWQMVIAQEEEIFDSIIQQLEDADIEDADWLEYFWELAEDPLDLNEASEFDLARIPFLAQDVIDDIIRLRRKKGELQSLDELLQIDNFSPELLEALRPFITVKQKLFSPKFIYRAQSRMESPARTGFEGKFQGNRLYLQNRLLFNLNPNLDGGIIWEKDPGEENYFDYGSFFLAYRHPGEKFNLILGDYQLKIGSGTAFWSPYGSPFSGRILPLLPKTRVPFSGNRSTNEIGYLRGIGMSYKIRQNIDLSFFYSNNKIDATMTPDGEFVSNLYSTGLHRFDTEENKRNILSESVIGVSSNWKIKSTDFQFSAIRSEYQPDFIASPGAMVHTSISYIYQGDQIIPGGEYTLFNGKFPAVHQYLYFPGDKFKYEVVAYYYHPQYFSARGRALGSFSETPANKSGVALMVWYQLAPNWILNGTLHSYRKNYQVDENLFTRKDYQFELLWKPGRNTTKLQYFRKYRENELAAFPDPELKVNGARLETNFVLSSEFKLRSRLELRWARPLEENMRYYGTNLFQQMEFKLMQQMRFIGRWSVFDIPDYVLRIYEFEPDLPGNFRTILLNGRGYKWFVLIRLDIGKAVQLDFKFQERNYPDLETVGSGPDQFNSNHIRDFRLSLIWRY